MPLEFPPSTPTDQTKFQYTNEYRLQQQMIFNLFGRWFNVGITQDEYDNGIPREELGGFPGDTVLRTITDRLKVEFPFIAQLPNADYQRFRNTFWAPDKGEASESYVQFSGLSRNGKQFDSDIDTRIFFTVQDRG